jgi:hypothetical protein
MSYRKKKESTCPQKSLIWGYALLTLSSLGVLLYLKQFVLPRYEREFTSFLIRTASHQVMNICREFAEIELQQKNLEIAEELGDRNLIDAYREQIKGRRARMNVQISNYHEIILKLGDFREKIVNTEFKNYTQALMKEKSFSKIHAVRLVNSTYQQDAVNKDAVSVKMLHQACKENLVKF